MHQYCLLSCACYIINTHTDMTWIWYDKSIRGEELEKKQGECIFHELQSSPAKVLDMIFQFQRLKGGHRGQDRQSVAAWKQTGDFICNCTHSDLSTFLITHPQVNFDQPCIFALGYWIEVLLKKTNKKKNYKCDTTSSDHSTSSDVSTSDGLWRFCSCWYLIKVKAGNFKGSVFDFFHNFHSDWRSYK